MPFGISAHPAVLADGERDSNHRNVTKGTEKALQDKTEKTLAGVKPHLADQKSVSHKSKAQSRFGEEV